MYRFVCILVKGFMSLLFRVKVNGKENIPSEGGFILCSNHISNWDPPLLQVFIRRRIYYMAKEELFKAFGLGFILRRIKAIPVHRSGSDITSIKNAIKTVKNGDVLGIFPTGQREKVKGEGEVKAGIGFLAVKTGGTVIPVHITASYRIFSKVIIDIGKPVDIKLPEGKPSTADFERISEDIYSEIKALVGE
ncbi:MAG: 1-acyl-sn-glycerol-3-phosphate acyltransferase [Clostridia bacterium]|nr:1-acyl-sn-glycerol-3-phosphate acyltransferase [Clostridia bacterium]